MKDITTTHLEDFGYIEKQCLIETLQAWNDHGLPKDFEASEVTAMFNRHSAEVFLINSEYQVAMLRGDGKLHSWYHCGNCGHEGFAEDCQLCDEGCNQCEPKESIQNP